MLDGNEIIAESGSSVILHPTKRLWDIFARHKISFGNRSWTDVKTIEMPKTTAIEEYACFVNGGSLLTSMGAGSYQMTAAPVGSVGRYCSIADHVSVMGERHPVEHVTTSGFPYDLGPARPTFGWMRRDFLDGREDAIYPSIASGPLPTIGHDVWIGEGALLKRGITLGHGCIVGARSIVTKDVPPYAIVGGSPARLIRMRFNEPTVVRFLALEWWNLHPRALFDLDIRSPERFLDQAERAYGSMEPFRPGVLKWESLLESISE